MSCDVYLDPVAGERAHQYEERKDGEQQRSPEDRDRLDEIQVPQLPDEAFPSYFLDVFGRPQRISACECERVTEANLAQALHLLNSLEPEAFERLAAQMKGAARDSGPGLDSEQLWFNQVAAAPLP